MTEPTYRERCIAEAEMVAERDALAKRIADARVRANRARRERHQVYTDLGLKRVRGAIGGVYYE